MPEKASLWMRCRKKWNASQEIVDFAVKEYLEENEETNYTRPMLMTYLTDIETSVELVSKIFDRNHPSEK